GGGVEGGDGPGRVAVFLRSRRLRRSRPTPSRCSLNPSADWPGGKWRETGRPRLSRQRERTPEDPALVNFCGLAIRVQRSSDQPGWIPDLLCALCSANLQVRDVTGLWGVYVSSYCRA